MEIKSIYLKQVAEMLVVVLLLLILVFVVQRVARQRVGLGCHSNCWGALWPEDSIPMLELSSLLDSLRADDVLAVESVVLERRFQFNYLYCPLKWNCMPYFTYPVESQEDIQVLARQAVDIVAVAEGMDSDKLKVIQCL